MIPDPALLAKEQGITSHFFADIEILVELLKENLSSGPQLGLMDQGRELPCYIIRIEEFYTPVCYEPPASRHILLARDESVDEWLLLGVNWFAGVSDMMLPSHLFIDELEMLVAAVQRLSAQSKVRIYSVVDILATTRSNHLAEKTESQAS